MLVVGASCSPTRQRDTMTYSTEPATAVRNVIVFHHALGRTPGIERFAARLREEGYRVMTPDLFDGRTFESIEQGVAHAESIGFDEIIRRGVASAAQVEGPLVVIGFSLGVLPAQQLAQTRPGVIGAVLCHAAVPVSKLGDAWPEGVALQMHFVKDDPWAREDLPVAQELAASVPGATLFVDPGTGHFVADSTHADYDAAIAELMTERIIGFLSRWK